MDFSRRQFLQLAAAGGASAVQAGWSNARVRASHTGTAGQPHHPAMPRYGMRHRRHGWKSHGGTLSKFVDRLPEPAAIHPSGRLNGVPLYRVTMRQFRTSGCTANCRRRRCGVQRQYPGPTFETRRGQPIAVRWRNNLPGDHLFPVAPTIHGAEPQPEVRTVVHVHGLKVLPRATAIRRPGSRRASPGTGPPSIASYHYPNDQAATGSGTTTTRSASPA